MWHWICSLKYIHKFQAVEKLSSVQRLACLCMMGAVRSTPMAAMPPFDIFIKGEARTGAYRLKCNDSW
jgi:hypothetical protein